MNSVFQSKETNYILIDFVQTKMLVFLFFLFSAADLLMIGANFDPLFLDGPLVPASQTSCVIPHHTVELIVMGREPSGDSVTRQVSIARPMAPQAQIKMASLQAFVAVI
jgi:hypothetical protein